MGDGGTTTPSGPCFSFTSLLPLPSNPAGGETGFTPLIVIPLDHLLFIKDKTNTLPRLSSKEIIPDS